ncbi:MBL fold metallo-hydrolase [Jiulongibacter sediminis]|uniref:MBL fold metallo-hydrolase n=1 Tax=Jiulongibacter sediminis TaxID=1605367 RepID=UPI0026F1B90E|nr:MBL fold metallo-hydrolase [Jiulongibacter sediminis]
MNLHVIDAGNFKLDGGAMFGVVPKTLWSKKIPADDLNLCSWKMRCLLIEDGNRLTLIDTGMGNKQSEKWLGYYFRHGEGDLIQSIREKGFHENQITDVILSHLHFDHAGGAVQWNDHKDKLQLTFPNARYWTHSDHWKWATNPNDREAATFLKENIMPLKDHGALYFTDTNQNDLPPNIEFLMADGHTEKMLMPLINTGDQKVLFIADTIPSHAHIHIPWVMGYDVRPLETMKEKKLILDRCVQENWLLYFDHDPFYEICQIEETEKGYRPLHEGTLHQHLIQ